MKNNIIESKIQVPRVSKNFIIRPRLLEQFQEELKLFVLHATVGYGKTVLMTQLNGVAGADVAWYHLNESDNDVITFMQYLSRSLEKIYGVLQFDLERYEGMEQNEKQLTEMTYDLLEQITKAQQKKIKDTFIVLDDFQVINNEKIDTVLEIFISSLETNLKVVVATKGSIPHFWSRFYIQGQGMLIGQKELGFNKEEIEMIVKQMVAEDKNPTEIAGRMYQSVGRWPAGVMFEILYLKQGGLQSSENIMGKAAVYDYIMRALYRKLPFDIQTFLSSTSALEFLNADVCNAVMKIDNSQSILNYLVQENLLIIKVGSGDRMFRYHSLMKEFLNEQLNDLTRKEIMKRAAEFYLHTDNKEQAVEYAINGENPELAEYAVGSIGIDMVNQGKLSTVERWINWMESCNINITPKTMLVYGVYNWKSGRINKGLDFINIAIEKFITSMNEVGYIQAMLEKARIMKVMGKDEESAGIIDELRPILRNKDRKKMVSNFCRENQIGFNINLDNNFKDNRENSQIVTLARQNPDNYREETIYIKAFGEFQVFIKGKTEEIKWRTRKAQELFAYLYHLNGEPVSKEELILLLWPDNQGKSATSLLHTALYSIRRELSTFGLDNLICYNKKKYLLNMDMINSDVQDLTVYYETLKNGKELHLEEEALSDIYTGSYMERMELDEFLPQRVNLEKMFLKVCEMEGIEDFKCGRFERTIMWMNRAVATDPFEESLQLLRIKSYAALRDFKNTKKYYEKMKEMLLKEFDLQPSEDIGEIWRKYVGGKNGV